MKKKFKEHRIGLAYLLLGFFILGGCSDDSPQDTTPPTVESVFPANAEPNVILNTEIRARFSEPIDPSTLSTSTFTVIESGTAASFAGTVTYDEANGVATFKPSPQLNANRTYTATVTTGVGDLAQNKMASDYRWLFTTGTAVDVGAPFFGTPQTNDPQLKAEATSSTTISLSWIAATDDTTPPGQMEYQICQSTDPELCKSVPFPASNVVLYRVAGGKTTFLAATEAPSQPVLTRRTLYYFVVRAIDTAGNSDTNIGQKSATTFGEWASLGPSLNNSTSRNASSPTVAVAGDTVYVVWDEQDPANTTLRNVYLRTFTDAGQWSPSIQSPRLGATKISQAGIARNPKLESNKGSTPIPYITYTECDNLGQSCRVFVKKRSGTTWVDEGIPPAINDPNAGSSDIAFDNSDLNNPIPYVLWTEQAGSGEMRLFLRHFSNGAWVADTPSPADGLSLNVNETENASHPAIAIHSTTDSTVIRLAWVECLTGNQNNCQLYLKKLSVSRATGEKTWTLPTDSLKISPQNNSIPIVGVSLSFVQGVFPNGTLPDATLFITWHESGTVYVREEKADGTLALVPPSSPITQKIQSSSNISIGGAGTGTQVPYLVFPVDPPSTSPFSTSPSLEVKRLVIDSTGTANWVTEGTALNMAQGGTKTQLMNSDIAFSQGTPYVAWMEKGSCLNLSPNTCGTSDTTAVQIYVKRLS